MTIFSVHIMIYGRVQNVFFRQTTYELAIQHGLSGYVRNRSNGSVEALFEGSEESVNFLVNWCQKGPRHASVQGVEIISREQGEQKKFESFRIELTL